jgi:hypothetical protein
MHSLPSCPRSPGIEPITDTFTVSVDGGESARPAPSPVPASLHSTQPGNGSASTSRPRRGATWAQSRSGSSARLRDRTQVSRAGWPDTSGTRLPCFAISGGSGGRPGAIRGLNGGLRATRACRRGEQRCKKPLLTRRLGTPRARKRRARVQRAEELGSDLRKCALVRHVTNLVAAGQRPALTKPPNARTAVSERVATRPRTRLRPRPFGAWGGLPMLSSTSDHLSDEGAAAASLVHTS